MESATGTKDENLLLAELLDWVKDEKITQDPDPELLLNFLRGCKLRICNKQNQREVQKLFKSSEKRTRVVRQQRSEFGGIKTIDSIRNHFVTTCQG